MTRIWFYLAVLILSHTHVQGAQSKTAATTNHGLIEALIVQSKQQKNASQSVEYAERAVYLADSLGLNEWKADALTQSGIAWKNWGDQLKSISRLEEAIALFRQLGLENKHYRATKELGETYRATRSYALSMARLKEALRYFINHPDSIMLARLHNRLAATSFEILFTHPAYLQMDTSKYQDKAAFGRALAKSPEVNIHFQHTIKHLDSSNAIAEDLGLKDILFSNMNIEAGILNLARDPVSALAMYDEMIDAMLSSGVDGDLALAYINKARVLGSYRMNRPEKAIALCLKALEMAKAQEINVYIFLAYEVLHDNYYAIRDYQKAYECLIAIREIFEQFNYEKMQVLIETQTLECKISQRELELQSRRVQIRLMVASIIVIVLLFSVFLFILAGKNRKQRSLLTQLNQQNQIITGQNQELSLTNSEKDKLFSIIAHDLKGPFQSILGFTELFRDEGVRMEPEEIRKISGLLHYSASRTAQLLDDLLNWARLQQGRIAFSPEPMLVGQMLDFIGELMQEKAQQKNIQIVSKLPENLSLKADKEMLKTILRNLLSNALKFSHPGGKVVISAMSENGYVKVSVSDSGIGVPADKIENLFSIGNEHIMPGTANEKGTGLGLVLCREFVEKHGGRIWVNSVEGEGSTFTFTIPLNGS